MTDDLLQPTRDAITSLRAQIEQEREATLARIERWSMFSRSVPELRRHELCEWERFYDRVRPMQHQIVALTKTAATFVGLRSHTIWLDDPQGDLPSVLLLDRLNR